MIYFYPGPTALNKEAALELSRSLPSPHDETALFLEDYEAAQTVMQKLLSSPSHFTAFLTGEGMASLYGAVSSLITDADKVLSLCSGLFGEGIAQMAQSQGANVTFFRAHQESLDFDYSALRTLCLEQRFSVVTLVHCETPSGLLSPTQKIMEVIRSSGQHPLVIMDAVSSLGGAPVQAEKLEIDVVLTATQKCLSLPPFGAMVSMSSRGWEKAKKISAIGYNGLAAFEPTRYKTQLPYTPFWQGFKALIKSAQMLLPSSKSYERHETCRKIVYEGLRDSGFQPYCREALSSPTVSAFYLPEGEQLPAFQEKLQKRGFGLSSSPLSPKLFRVGHMGMQADAKSCQALVEALKQEYK